MLVLDQHVGARNYGAKKRAATVALDVWNALGEDARDLLTKGKITAQEAAAILEAAMLQSGRLRPPRGGDYTESFGGGSSSDAPPQAGTRPRPMESRRAS